MDNSLTVPTVPKDGLYQFLALAQDDDIAAVQDLRQRWQNQG